MRTRLIVCVCAMLAAAGCVPSLHSIVTEKTLVYDPGLPGLYQMDDSFWTISGDPNEKTYSLVIKEKGDKESLLTARLVEIEGHRFLDLYPEGDVKLNTGDWFNAHILPVHGFWRLEKSDSAYKIAAMDPDALKDLLKDKPQMIKHEVVEEDRVVLTDTPENLQKFLVAGLSIEKFYGDFSELKPVKK